MKFTLDLDNDLYFGPTDLDTSFQNTKSLYDLIKSYSDNAWIETGLLPVSGAGLLSYRAAFGHEQIIYQLPPGIYTIRWGEREHDEDAQNYSLAHPWKVIIADFNNNNFLGLRHFYSSDPITYWDQQLYAVNLPNTNTLGYNGTSVGWTCLYLNDDTRSYTLDQKIEYVIHRESGLSEPYNDNNMRNTDGTRFYENLGKPSYMYDPSEWQLKTLEEGYSWILNPELLVPLHVPETGHAEKYHSQAPCYTLRRASFEPYSAYYSDHTYVKPFNILSANGFTAEHRHIWITPLIGASSSTTSKPVADPKEVISSPFTFTFPKNLLAYTKNGWNCNSCGTKYTHQSSSYDVVVSYNYDSDSDTYDFSYKQFCTSCVDEDTIYLGDHGEYFVLSSLIYAEKTDSWHLLNDVYLCNACSTAYAYDPFYQGVRKHLIYTHIHPEIFELSISNGCISCIDPDKIVTCDMTGHNIHVDHSVSHSKIAIEVTPNDDPSLPGIPKLVKTTVHSSMSMALSKNMLRCGCDFLVPKNTFSILAGDNKYPSVDALTGEPCNAYLYCHSCVNACIDDNGTQYKYTNIINNFPDAQIQSVNIQNQKENLSETLF